MNQNREAAAHTQVGGGRPDTGATACRTEYTCPVSLSISSEAAELIRARATSVHLEMPAIIVTACCAQSFQDRPTVRFGPPPPELGMFDAQSVGDVTVF